MNATNECVGSDCLERLKDAPEVAIDEPKKARQSQMDERRLGYLLVERYAAWTLSPLVGNKCQVCCANTEIPTVGVTVLVDGDQAADLVKPSPLSKGSHVQILEFDPKLLDGEEHRIDVKEKDTGRLVNGSPLLVGCDHYDLDWRVRSDGIVEGWVRQRVAEPDVAVVRLYADERLAGEVEANGLVRLELDEERIEYLGFRITLPNWVWDGTQHHLVLEVAGQAPFCSVINSFVASRVHGAFDRTSEGIVEGWAVDLHFVDRPVELDLWVNNEVVASTRAQLRRDDVFDSFRLKRNCGFAFRIQPLPGPSRALDYQVCAAGTGHAVLGKRVVFSPRDVSIRGLGALAEATHRQTGRLSAGLIDTPAAFTWIRREVIPRLISGMRAADEGAALKIEIPPPPLVLPSTDAIEDTVDVIVPVYKGLPETIACIRSIVSASNTTPYELTVIYDCGPEPEMLPVLTHLAAQFGFVLLENHENVGFVRTANRGLRLHQQRDVVLLNADTRVPDKWLDRLRRTAQSDINVGTVTPFSNNATICSFPETCVENDLVSGMSMEEMDALFAEVNTGLALDIPTAHGFCVYIARQCLAEVGYFDEDTFGLGYGEENDFSVRAADLGWRNLLCADLFVWHQGSVSFGASTRLAEIQRNLKAIASRYPDYEATVHRFIAQDPVARLRHRVQVRLLTQSGRRFLLFVSHAQGGGIDVHIRRLLEQLRSEEVAVLLLTSDRGRWEMRVDGNAYRFSYTGEHALSQLCDDLAALELVHIHFHHTADYPFGLFDLPQKLGVTYDFTAHDYLPMCPRVTLIGEGGVYCGKARFNRSACERCVKQMSVHPVIGQNYLRIGSDIQAWRSTHARFLARARCIFAPTKETARRYREHFPDLHNIRVAPHPEAKIDSDITVTVGRDGILNLAIIGAIGPQKGFYSLLRLVRAASLTEAPFRFIVIGHTCDDAALLNYSNVTITGAYESVELARLIGKYRCSVALFLSPWPETYSYTLSEALMNGLFPVAPNLGAFAERMEALNVGLLFPSDASTQQLLAILHRLMNNPPHGQHLEAPGWDDAKRTVLCDYYGLEASDSGG